MSVQVQLRGGTSIEHSSFIGAPREITVDTDRNTLVIHDGNKLGGHPLATEQALTAYQQTINDRLIEFENNVGATHNHDDLYSKLDHNHDTRYVVTPIGVTGSFLKKIGDYNGLVDSVGGDTNYIRTPKNGLIPYQGGGYSNIGSPTWRFANGYYNNLNVNTLVVENGMIDFNGSAGSINFNNDDVLAYNDTTNEYTLTSDSDVNKSRLKLGHIELSGRRIYTGSSFPADARVNDILIQV